MHPVLVRVGPFTLYSYGLMVALAFGTTMYLAVRRAGKYGLGQEEVANLGIVCILSGIIGARLLYVVMNLDYYITYPKEIFALWHGGLVYVGGIVGGIIGGVIYIRAKGMPGWRVADLIAPLIALGHGIGRIGCFLNGCCYGKPTNLPWGVVFKAESEAGHAFPGIPIHPTQLYESLVEFAIFIVLTLYERKKRVDGSLILLYVLLYGTARFMLEYLRADAPHTPFGLTIFQIGVLPVMVIAAFLLWRLRRKYS